MLKSLFRVMLGGCLISSLYGVNLDFSRQIQRKYWVPSKNFNRHSKNMRVAADHLKIFPSQKLLNRFQRCRLSKRNNTYTLFQVADKKMRAISLPKNEQPRNPYTFLKHK
jgi:hypothetical protein